MLRSLSCLALIVLVASVCATPASAQCAGFSQVFGHQIGGTLVRCADNGQVSGFVFAIGATATINSSTVLAPPQTADFICEADGEPSQGFGTCVGGACVGGARVGRARVDDARVGRPRIDRARVALARIRLESGEARVDPVHAAALAATDEPGHRRREEDQHQPTPEHRHRTRPQHAACRAHARRE